MSINLKSLSLVELKNLLIQIKEEIELREHQNKESKKVIADYSELIELALKPGYARTHKLWIKLLSSVNIEYKNGYAFEGKFLEVKEGKLTENELHKNKYYLVYGDYGSVKNHEPYAAVCTFNFETDCFEVYQDLKTSGFDWALTLRDATAKLIN